MRWQKACWPCASSGATPGWGELQLEAELAEGAWMVLPAELDDVFSQRAGDLWRTVLRRQGGRLAWVANAPDDLSSN
jgi:putative transcriptional regulator